MTFDKYGGNHTGNPFATTVFPDDGYLYDYVFDKKRGWMQIKGEKIEDLPEQEYDIRIPEEVKEK